MSKKVKRLHIVELGSRAGTTLLTECTRVCYNFDFVSEYEDSIFNGDLNIG